MANDTRYGVPVNSPGLNVDELEAMLAELDAICRQARELTTAIKVDMAKQKEQEKQVLGPQRFLRPVSQAK